MFPFTIEQIECFQRVVEEGSFTKASEKLNKAKSAVIYSVKKLEEQLGFTLVDRGHYRSRPTRQGLEFLNSAEQLLNASESLTKLSAQIASDVETRMCLSVSGVYDMSRVFPIMRKTMSAFPHTEVLLEREILSGEKMLLEERVDLAIFERVQERELLEYKRIDKVRLLLVISGAHEFLSLKKKDQTWANLYRYPQIIQRSTISGDPTHRGVHQQAIKWKVTDTHSKKEIIINGMGWGRLPEFLVKEEISKKNLCHLRWLEDDEEVPIFICRRKNTTMGKVSQFVWDSF